MRADVTQGNEDKPAAEGSLTETSMSIAGVPSVETYQNCLRELLHYGQRLRTTGSIEAQLKSDDVKGGIDRIGQLSRSPGNKSYAAIETACRNIFYNILVITLSLQ